MTMSSENSFVIKTITTWMFWFFMSVTLASYVIYLVSMKKRPEDVYNMAEKNFEAISQKLDKTARAEIMANSIDAADVGFIGCDEFFNVVWVSAGMERMYGGTVPLGKPPMDLIPVPFREVHSGNLTQVRDAVMGSHWEVIHPDSGGGYLNRKGEFVPAVIRVQRVDSHRGKAPLLSMIVEKARVVPVGEQGFHLPDEVKLRESAVTTREK